MGADHRDHALGLGGLQGEDRGRGGDSGGDRRRRGDAGEQVGTFGPYEKGAVRAVNNCIISDRDSFQVELTLTAARDGETFAERSWTDTLPR